MKDLYELLVSLREASRLPKVIAYNRLDGPGSSLDLREFQAALWTIPANEAPDDEDDFAAWSAGMPRTVGMTIDTGSSVEAHPFRPNHVGIASSDFGYEYSFVAGHVPFRSEYWLLKILDIFGLSGVRFELHNLVPGIKSSGLGGSATAATAVCILANALSGAQFNPEQLVALASLLEQDLGISITGTQEQSNVIFGGVTDYVWFPWGIPGAGGSYGTSIRRTLMTEDLYPELAARLRIFHTGSERSSIDVNSVWRRRLSEPDGFELHRKKPAIAFDYREGLRKQDWERMAVAIRQYRRVRTELCADYMTGATWDIQAQCEALGAESFPLGAGGGGAVMVFGASPSHLQELEAVLTKVFRRIDFTLQPRGHKTENVRFQMS